MDSQSLLAPAAVLILWSLIILLWLVVTRFAGFAKAGVKLSDAERGARYADVESQMPANVNWVSHNWTHLMEQPTLFYAVVAVLALADGASALTVALAWGYTGLRIVHSLWQCLVNVVLVRVVLFTMMTLCLFGLALAAVSQTLF